MEFIRLSMRLGDAGWITDGDLRQAGLNFAARMEWNGIKNIIKPCKERLGIEIEKREDGWKRDRSFTNTWNNHAIWISGEECLLVQASYQSLMKHLRQSCNSKIGERRRRSLEEGSVEEDEARSLWQAIKRTMTDTRTRDFAFRLINGLLFANKDLHKFGIKQYSNCPECTEQQQSTKHLMWECDGTKRILQLAKNELNCNWPDNALLKDILELNQRDLAIWIKVMHSIYLNNILETPLTWHNVLGSVKEYKITQNIIAEQQGKMGKFLTIWAGI